MTFNLKRIEVRVEEEGLIAFLSGGFPFSSQSGIMDREQD